MRFLNFIFGNKAIKLILLCFGLFLLFSLIYRVGLSEIIKAISGAKLSIAFLGVLVYLTVILIRSYKWLLLTRIIKNKINYRQFVPFYLINSLVGNLTPFKFGEAGTPFLFRKYLKIPIGQGFSIIILDRFFELVVFTVILVLAVFYILNQGIQNSLILSVFRGVLVALFLLLAVFITAIVSKRITLKIVKSFRLARFIERELDGFYNTLSLFKNKKAYQLVMPLILLTSIGWLLEILAFYLIFSSVLPAPFMRIAVAQIIATAATYVSFVPNGVGVGEVGVVYVLGLLGYPLALTTSGAILVRLFSDAVVIITGLISFVLIRKQEYNE